MTRVIVDANVACMVFQRPTDSKWNDLHEALLYGRRFVIVAVHGGTLTREYEKISKLKRVFVQLDRAGRLHAFPHKSVDGETSTVSSSGICRSNDSHIIALALISRARVLCTDDPALMTDFKNKRLISSPRGSVYRGSKNNHLLR